MGSYRSLKISAPCTQLRWFFTLPQFVSFFYPPHAFSVALFLFVPVSLPFVLLSFRLLLFPSFWPFFLVFCRFLFPRWWKQGRDDLGTCFCQMKTLFFYKKKILNHPAPAFAILPRPPAPLQTVLAVGQPPARQAGRLQIHSTTDPCLRGFGALIGPARIWAAIAGFKVESANRYTTGPAVSASNSNSVLQTSWRQKDVQSRWWKQGRDDLGTFFGQMKTLFF